MFSVNHDYTILHNFEDVGHLQKEKTQEPFEDI
jgi:hypothetical protein